MKFWIELDFEVTYQKLVGDINKEFVSTSSPGYNYFANLLKSLLRGYKVKSFDGLVYYLKNNADNLNFIIKTSGTTAAPKSIEVNLKNCIREVKYTKSNVNKVWGMGYPFGSYASTQVFFQALFNHDSIVYISGIKFSALGGVLHQNKITNLSCTPTFLSMMTIQLKKKYPSIKKITTGGEILTPNLINICKEHYPFAGFVNIYATTEVGSLLYSKNEVFKIPDKYRSQVKIKDSQIWVHKSLISQNKGIENSWFNTNDQVQFVNDEEFKIIGRTKGYLKTGGFRVSPKEIEEKISVIMGVTNVHVYGKKNSLLGTIICADIIGENLSKDLIKKNLYSMGLDKYKIPQIIRIVKQFEHLINGKKQLII